MEKKSLKDLFSTRLRIGKKEILLLLCVVILLVTLISLSAEKRETGDEEALVMASTELEERLAATLSQIRGAGRVKVMVTYSSKEDTAVGGLFSSSVKETQPEVVGAIIVAEGADDIGVTFELVTAARTVLGIKASAVKVFVMEDQ